MASLMVFTPTWIKADGTQAMRPECRAAIEAQQFDGGLQWVVGLDNPYPLGAHRNVLHQYQQARHLFLASGADALLFVEHDNVLPDATTAQRLYDTALPDGRPADVVYGVYLLRHGMKVLNAWRYEGDRNLGQSLTLFPEELRRAREGGRPVRVSGAGFGCILIRRPIVERFPFHDGGDQQLSPDVPFAIDVLHAGVVSLARFDVACDHWDGDVRWPAEGEGITDMVKVTALQTVNVLVDGRVMHLERGEPYDLPRSTVGDMERAGFVRIEDEAAAIVEVATAEPLAERAVLPRGKGRKRVTDAA